MEGPDEQDDDQGETSISKTHGNGDTFGPESSGNTHEVLSTGSEEEEDRLTYRGPTKVIESFTWDARAREQHDESRVTEDTVWEKGSLSSSTQSLENLLGETFKLVRRFYEKTVHKDNGCREWTGAFSDSLYGTFSVLGKTRLVHRFSYRLHNGDIPPGMLVCHKCDNPKCCNPDHLFLGNASANMKDASEKGRLKNIFTAGGGRDESFITEDKVLQIRMLADKGVQVREIGNIYGVKPSTIRDIIKRRTWNNVK